MAGGDRAVFRRRRRMPHGVPLPADAAHVHGDRPGGPAPDHRHHAPDPRDPRGLPMGDLPAQPRRADPRNGHRRGARLSLVVLRRRAARPDQPRHPPPPRAAPRERPAQDRADEVPRPVDARHAGALLRRRDRHGRQHLPRRPRRRAHADAVDPRPQRRLLPGEPAAAVPAGDPGPDLRLRRDQRRGADPGADQPAELDAAHDRDPQQQRRPGPRHDPVPLSVEPQGPGLDPRARGRAGPVRGQPVARAPGGAARPVGTAHRGADRAHRRHRVPADRRPALPADPAVLRLLLVLARARRAPASSARSRSRRSCSPWC